MRKIVKPFKNILDDHALIPPNTEFNRRAAAYVEIMRKRDASREWQRRKAKRKRETE